MSADAKIAPVSSSLSAGSAFMGGGQSHSRPSRDAERLARYRLVIEEGPQQGSFIYKTLDRVTGEVVRQLPREQVVEMMRSDDYAQGAVIDTNV